MRVHLYPTFGGEDKGDGGVRRVVEGQLKSLAKHKIQFVDRPGDADLIACHISAPTPYFDSFNEKPLVSHCHGLYWSEETWESWSYKANDEVMKLILAADITTAPSEWVAAIIRRHTSRDVRVVPHGVVLKDWTPVEEHRGYVLWNKTRIDPICDPEPLNALVRAMPTQGFVSTFGNEASNITLVGKVGYEPSKELTRNAGVYLCTSRETFGIGTLEAMAAGVPVVGYAFGGQAEIVTHGVDGWLVEPGDIDGMAEGVRWALANREQVGAAAIETARKYTWEAAAKRYVDIYQELTSRYLAAEESPKVSIIVTAYNLEKWLPETLDSVMAQTERDWECIVVDDASPDSCGEIADGYAEVDKRFRVIHNEKNLYLADARNVGIDNARGKYILPLDADDRLHVQAVRVLADALEADRTLHVAYGNVFFTDENNVPVNYGNDPGHSKWPVPYDAHKQTLGWNLLPYSSMYRREAWRLVGGYRRRLKTSEDADFWTRLAAYGFRAEYVTDMDTLIYRARDDSMSVSNRDLEKAYMRWHPYGADQNLLPAGAAGNKHISLLEPMISIVIPVGPGHARLVQDAVDSVAAQSYQKWEIIVVNDSGEKLTCLPSFVRVFETDARDPATARNIGISHARSKLYIPLDADDYLQPDALQWFLTAYVESDGEIIYPDFYEDPDDEGMFSLYHTQDYSCERLIREGAMHPVTALTPVAVWKDVGGYEPNIGWEDWDFQLKTARAGHCSRRLAAPLFTYRKHTGMRAGFDDAEFERRKNEMMSRWTREDGVKIMSCGCAGKTITPINQSSGARRAEGPEGAVLIEYTGKKASARYRGTQGHSYYFGEGDPPKFIMAYDVDVFMRLGSFRVIGSTPAELEPVL